MKNLPKTLALIIFAVLVFTLVVCIKVYFYKECRTVHDSVVYCLGR